VKQALYHLNHTSSPFCSSYFGESHELFAKPDLELWSSQSQPLQYLGLQVWVTGTWLFFTFDLWTVLFPNLQTQCWKLFHLANSHEFIQTYINQFKEKLYFYVVFYILQMSS
jgi:hypothetical protein